MPWERTSFQTDLQRTELTHVFESCYQSTLRGLARETQPCTGNEFFLLGHVSLAFAHEDIRRNLRLSVPTMDLDGRAAQAEESHTCGIFPDVRFCFPSRTAERQQVLTIINSPAVVLNHDSA